MSSSVRLKLISEKEENVGPLSQKLHSLGYQHSFYSSVEDACESLETEPADGFIIDAAELSQSAASLVQKHEVAPQIIAYSRDKRLPNYVKVVAPFLLHEQYSAAETQYVVDTAVASLRKNRRLIALRTHQKNGWKFEYNPALNLITSLVKKCTIAEDFPDLLNAMLTFRNVIEFQDSSLVLFDHKGKILQALHAPAEKSENMVLLDEKVDFPVNEFEFDEPKATSFSSAQHWNHPLGKFTKHPWGSGIAIAFRAPDAPKRKGIANSAMLILYRRELIPFSERDLWLLEMTYGPLALALEKVVMLKAISQASKEWRSTFDGISEPLTVINNDFYIVKASKAFAALIGHDIKKIKSKKCHALLANRRTPCPGCPALLEEPQTSGVRLSRQGKEKKDLIVWSYGIRTGLESYHFQFYRDVSKETALASTLIQSEKMAALGKLVGAIAHEINNPLAAILATSQILLSDADPAVKPFAEDIRDIKDAAWRSKKIIDDLLGFTEGRDDAREEVDIQDIIKATLTFAHSALREMKVTSEIESCKIKTSTSSLQQVLFNLITNAVQAMNGKGELRLHSKLDSRGELLLTVEDNGPGISPDRLKHIFDPFYTSKQEGSGTGLGLSIVKNLAAKIGVKIHVESTLGSGTRFSLSIPRDGAKHA